MKGKRLLAALMASAMALGMTACGGSGGGVVHLILITFCC